MSEERWYRGALMRRRYRDSKPHGWWLLPEGPLEDHPDKGWVPTLEEAHTEIDQHLQGGECRLRERGRWLGVLARPILVESMFDRTLQGYSAWCSARQGQLHEPCSTGGCPCGCHGESVR